MLITVLVYELYLPDCHSLKGKRSVVKSLKQRLRNKFNVSVAEVDHLDIWQRAKIAVVLAARDGNGVDSVLSAVDNLVNLDYKLQVLDTEKICY